MTTIKDLLLAQLPGHLPPEEIRRWFGPLVWHFDQACQRLELTAPTTFHRNRIVDKYADLLLGLADHLGHPLVGLTVTAARGLNKAGLTINVNAPQSPQKPPNFSPVSENHSFQRFFTAPGNLLAFWALNHISTDTRTLGAKVLFVVSSGPWGKTHLLNALTLELANEARRPFLKINGGPDLHLPEADLWRGAEIIIVDDIHLLSSESQVQPRLLQAFDAAMTRPLRLIFSAPFAPHKLANLSEALRSRLSGGLMLKIEPPEFSLLLEIGRRLAQESNLEMSEELLSLLAKEANGDPRRLEGLCQTIAFIAARTGLNPAEAVNRLNLAKPDPSLTSVVEMNAIINGVATAFGLKAADLTAHSKLRQAAWPRRVAMFLARELTALTTTEIGAALGGRDHSTVIHALKKIQVELKNPSQIQIVENIKRSIIVTDI